MATIKDEYTSHCEEIQTLLSRVKNLENDRCIDVESWQAQRTTLGAQLKAAETALSASNALNLNNQTRAEFLERESTRQIQQLETQLETHTEVTQARINEVTLAVLTTQSM